MAPIGMNLQATAHWLDGDELSSQMGMMLRSNLAERNINFFSDFELSFRGFHFRFFGIFGPLGVDCDMQR